MSLVLRNRTGPNTPGAEGKVHLLSLLSIVFLIHVRIPLAFLVGLGWVKGFYSSWMARRKTQSTSLIASITPNPPDFLPELCCDASALRIFKKFSLVLAETFQSSNNLLMLYAGFRWSPKEGGWNSYSSLCTLPSKFRTKKDFITITVTPIPVTCTFF